MKRICDVVVAALLFLLFSPLLLFVALIVKLDSKGPVIFKQKRAGLNVNYFDILKFRSMTVRNETDGKDFEPGSGTRVTRVGGILRKTKIDELPQLVNVLKGDMSLVGPRPEVAKYVEMFPERWSKILSIRPGLTDPASIEFRNEEEILASSDDPEREYIENVLPRKMDLYERYVDDTTFGGDLRILLATFAVVIGK
ncbi:MAG: sugar transferase [Victivallales bacterium]|nr:sugar transferase [Victivallales bacterium]